MRYYVGGLQGVPGLETVGEAGISEELLTQLVATAPSAALLGFNLLGPKASALLLALSEQCPQLLSWAVANAPTKTIARALNLGAHGYLLKKSLAHRVGLRLGHRGGRAAIFVFCHWVGAVELAPREPLRAGAEQARNGSAESSGR